MAKSTCSAEGCGRPTDGRSLCGKHYQQQRAKTLDFGPCSAEGCGRPARIKSLQLCLKHYQQQRSESAALCVVDGCNIKSHARGLCSRHAKWEQGNPCSVDGCDRYAEVRGYCSPHYYRVWKHGDPGEAELRRNPAPRDCKVDGCANPACGLDDLCMTHHLRMKTFGNTDGRLCECGAKAVRNLPRCREHHIAWMREQIGNLQRPPTNRGSERKVNGGGYITYNVLGIAIHEHRAVMERGLGRLLEPFENVHHKNGVRTDNRPENLELWVTMQPTGQRPEDLVQWVVDHYPALVREQLEGVTHG